MPKSDVIKIKQMRLAILEHLNMTYPSGMQTTHLYRTVIIYDQTYDFDLFRKDISYMVQKGWVKYIDSPFGMQSFDKRTVILTAEGKEIAEGTDTDKALEI